MRMIACAKDPMLSSRFPPDVMKFLRTSAQKNGRSLNSELIWRVRQAMALEAETNPQNPTAVSAEAS